MESAFYGLVFSLLAIISSVIGLVKDYCDFYKITLLVSLACLMFNMGRLFGAW